MELGQLKPNSILRGALFNEPVQVIAILPLGNSVKIIGTGTENGIDASAGPLTGPSGHARNLVRPEILRRRLTPLPPRR